MAFRSSARTNTLAIVALIAAFVFAPAGLICGFIARNQIKQTKEQGDGMALAAILISAIAILIWVSAAVFAVSLFDHVVSHCVSFVPPTPAPGLRWVCSGNNTWISSG
jgi:ABC-type spermidine/putrescine transport system permease subunit II